MEQAGSAADTSAQVETGAQTTGRRPRILFVSHTAEWGGPTNSLFELLIRLRVRFECTVLLPGTGAFTDRLKEERIPFTSLRNLRKGQMLAMRRAMRRERADLVYGNNTSSATKNAFIAARLAGVPLIYHIRAMAGSRNWRKVGFLRLADATIAVSHATAESYGRFLHPERSFVVHNGIPLDGIPRRSAPEARRTARRRLAELAPLPEDALVLIGVGNVDRRKAYGHAVRAMLRVAREKEGAQLFIAGHLARAGDYAAELRGLIDDLGLTHRVHLLGFRHDVTDLLAGCDLFVHTALEDPHPRAVLEAMGADLPVVAYGTDGVGETVVDGETGLLVQTGDQEALARALVDLATDCDRLSSYGRAGRRRVEECFSADETARRVGDVIERTLSRRASREP